MSVSVLFRCGNGVSSFVIHAPDASYPKTCTNAFLTKYDNFEENALHGAWIDTISYQSGYSDARIKDIDTGSEWKVSDDKYIKTTANRRIEVYAIRQTSSNLVINASGASVIREVKLSNNVTYDFSGGYSQSHSYSAAVKFNSVTMSTSGSTWTGKLYWGSSSGAKTYQFATVTSGVVSMVAQASQEAIDFLSSGRTIYLTSERTISYLTIDVSKASIVQGMTLTNSSVYDFYGQQSDRHEYRAGVKISAVSLSSSVTSGTNGTLYWGSSSGSKSWQFATITNGVLYLVPTESQEQIDFLTSGRTIYITAELATTYYLTINAAEAPQISSMTFSNGQSVLFSSPSQRIPFSSNVTITSVTLKSSDPLYGRMYYGPSSGAKTTLFLTATYNPKTSTQTKSIISHSAITFGNANKTIYLTSEKEEFTYNVYYYSNITDYTTVWKRDYVDGVTAFYYDFDIPTTYPTRSGYDFDGWSTSHSADEGTYYPGASVRVYCSDSSQTIKLYAVWHQTVHRYDAELIYDSNGGSFSGGSTTRSETTWAYDTTSCTFNFTVSSIEPSKEDWRFLGWATTNFASTPEYEAGDIYSFTSYNPDRPEVRTLFAVWAQVTATLTLDAQEGTFPGTIGKIKTVRALVNSTINLSNHQPSYERYILQGWNSHGPAGTTIDYGPTDSITLTPTGIGGSADKTLYALWERDILSKFYWSNISDAEDNLLVAQGLPISAAITAASWNRLKLKIKDLATRSGISYSYANVSKGDRITAAEFNEVRYIISLFTGRGTIPSSKSAGDRIMASYFNGSQSIKSGLNNAIDYYNDH